MQELPITNAYIEVGIAVIVTQTIISVIFSITTITQGINHGNHKAHGNSTGKHAYRANAVGIIPAVQHTKGLKSRIGIEKIHTKGGIAPSTTTLHVEVH